MLRKFSSLVGVCWSRFLFCPDCGYGGCRYSSISDAQVAHRDRRRKGVREAGGYCHSVCACCCSVRTVLTSCSCFILRVGLLLVGFQVNRSRVSDYTIYSSVLEAISNSKLCLLLFMRWFVCPESRCGQVLPTWLLFAHEVPLNSYKVAATRLFYNRSPLLARYERASHSSSWLLSFVESSTRKPIRLFIALCSLRPFFYHCHHDSHTSPVTVRQRFGWEVA
jgi:energy-converting hydrogenase Eha subunit B